MKQQGSDEKVGSNYGGLRGSADAVPAGQGPEGEYRRADDALVPERDPAHPDHRRWRDAQMQVPGQRNSPNPDGTTPPSRSPESGTVE